MNEWFLKDGTPIIVVRSDINVTSGVFAMSLAEKYYFLNEDFPEKLTKKEGYKILKSRLYQHGRHGEIPDGFFEATSEEGEEFNRLYDLALEWVKSKYKHLDNYNEESITRTT